MNIRRFRIAFFFLIGFVFFTSFNITKANALTTFPDEPTFDMGLLTSKVTKPYWFISKHNVKNSYGYYTVIYALAQFDTVPTFTKYSSYGVDVGGTVYPYGTADNSTLSWYGVTDNQFNSSYYTNAYRVSAYNITGSTTYESVSLGSSSPRPSMVISERSFPYAPEGLSSIFDTGVILSNFALKEVTGNGENIIYDPSAPPSMGDVDDYNFDVGKMYIAYPQKDEIIQSNGFVIRFKLKAPYVGSGSMTTLNNVDESAVLKEIETTMVVNIKGQSYSSFKTRNVKFDDDSKTAAKRGWYKVSGEVVITNLDEFSMTDGNFKIDIGSNVITGVYSNVLQRSYTREWYSASSSAIYKGFVDNDGDGLDDNTGTHIGEDGDGGNPDGFPQEPNNGSILDYLKYYGEILIWIVNIPVNLLKDLVGFLTSTFNSVSTSFSEMGTFFSSFFSFLPGPLAGSLWLVLIAMFITGIIKIVR